MKALLLTAHGTLDPLAWSETPAPVPGPGEVRVRLRASALNHLDLFVLEGLPGLKLAFPHVGGADGAGTVDAAGPGVEGWSAGRRVVFDPGLSCGTCPFCLRGEQSLCDSFGILGEHKPGTFAEFVCVPAVNLAPAPDHLSDAEAAAFPLTWLTAYRMLFTRGRLGPGESVLIHGVGAGVSLAALQMAKAAGAAVYVTSSSDNKLERARELGADAGVNYARDRVDKALQELTHGLGVDVVVDSVGAATWMTSLKCAKKGGRILTCGATSGPNPAEEIRLVFWKQLSILGSTMGSRSDFARMLAFLCARKLHPIVDAVFPLDRAREAYERLGKGEQFGKIVLDHGAL
jgi:NADPH:quinone reductase-like Zn-dependent oxidoreductase